MCFSASASFSAGAVLTILGAASLKKTTKPFATPFATIPLLFAVQQFAEGVLWLSLGHFDGIPFEQFATILYITIAQVIWPVWIPLTVLLLERNSQIRKLLYVLVGFGIIVSVYLAWCLLSFGVKAQLEENHITYIQVYPQQFMTLGGLLYVIVTTTPAFLSGHKKMWLVGAAILLSYFITKMYYQDYLVSVWCFFASIISAFVYWVVLEINKEEPLLQSNLKTSLHNHSL